MNIEAHFLLTANVKRAGILKNRQEPIWATLFIHLRAGCNFTLIRPSAEEVSHVSPEISGSTA